MTWHRATVDNLHSCGSCTAPIAKDEVYLTTRSGKVRCLVCAKPFGDPPDVIEDDPAPPATVPDGVQHQASLSFLSAGELARGHVARHLANRQRGAR